MSTQQERAEQRRREKLQQIRKQVDKGELTIRQMTKAEREKHPPQPRPAQRRR